MNPIRAAIYTRLAGDATLTGMLSAPDAIYHQVAPQAASYPLIVFHRQAGTPQWTFRSHTQWDLWLVKAIDKAGSASTVENIGARIDVLLNDTELAIDEHRLLYLRRDSDIDFAENDGADTYRHYGGIYRLVVEPA